MSLALAHFAVGATGTTLLLAPLPVRVRCERTLILLGGIWALLPDIYKLAPIHELAPVAAERMHAIHGSAVANLFWFHRALDVRDPTDAYLVTVVAAGSWVGVTALVEMTSILWARLQHRRTEPRKQISD